MLPGDALHRLQAVPGLRANQPGIVPPKKVLPVSEETVQAILPHLTPTVRAMVEVQSLTGMRPGAVCRLTTGEIDRSGDVWAYRPSQHKTKHRDKGALMAKLQLDAAELAGDNPTPARRMVAELVVFNAIEAWLLNTCAAMDFDGAGVRTSKRRTAALGRLLASLRTLEQIKALERPVVLATQINVNPK